MKRFNTLRLQLMMGIASILNWLIKSPILQRRKIALGAALLLSIVSTQACSGTDKNKKNDGDNPIDSEVISCYAAQVNDSTVQAPIDTSSTNTAKNNSNTNSEITNKPPMHTCYTQMAPKDSHK